MSRAYAYPEDGGGRILVTIKCDAAGCGAEIKPSPDIASSGWTKSGAVNVATMGSASEPNDWCPEHGKP